MRGKLRYNLAKVIQIRITPADAGKTRDGHKYRGILRDHPRGCGENPDAIYRKAKKQGSPPRMRGKLFGYVACGYNDRITPADAGKTRKLIQDLWK